MLINYNDTRRSQKVKNLLPVIMKLTALCDSIAYSYVLHVTRWQACSLAQA